MSGPNYFPGDLTVGGTLAAKYMAIPTNVVQDSSVRSDADIASSKVQQEIRKTHFLSAHATAAAVTRQVIHCAYKAGTVMAFGAGATVAPTGGDTVTVTLKKNGVAILTSSIVLDSGNTNFIIEDGSISSATLSANDVLEVEITGVSGTTGKGVFVRFVVTEDSTGA